MFKSVLWNKTTLSLPLLCESESILKCPWGSVTLTKLFSSSALEKLDYIWTPKNMYVTSEVSLSFSEMKAKFIFRDYS